MLSRHTKRAILGLAFAGVTLLVIGAASRHYFAGRALELRLEQERASLVPPEPMLLAVERSDRTRERSFAVRLQPYRRSAVAAEATGRIAEVLVEVGDSVDAGQPMFRLDAALARLNVESAQAALQAAEAQLQEVQRRAEEAERLAAAQTIPETQLEAVRAEAEVQAAELERLRSELRRQEEMLARNEVRAPFAGIVNQRLVDLGDSVNLNQPVASLVTLDPLRLRFFVSDTEVTSFQKSDILRLRIPSHPEKEFQAPVVSVAQSTDPVSGLFLIEGEVPNPEQAIPGGARGRVIADIREYTNMPFVPASAVRFEGQRALVEIWTAEGITLRQLELGPEIDGHYPVLDGIEEGEILVVH